jgi:hypothetical protein
MDLVEHLNTFRRRSTPRSSVLAHSWIVLFGVALLACGEAPVDQGRPGLAGSTTPAGGAGIADDGAGGGISAGGGEAGARVEGGSGGGAAGGAAGSESEGGALDAGQSGRAGGGGSAATQDAGGCNGDPTAGFTEYTDTFKVQHPYDLAESDRFTFENGIYTTWVYPTDKPFQQGSATGPRTEMRWSQNWSSGERIWEADVMYESPAGQSCIMQVKGNAPIGGEAMYLQVNGGNLRNSVKPPFLMNSYDKWMNIKTAYNTATRVGRVWIDNCLLYTTTYSEDAEWYFKNGTYGCNTAICRAHFKNIKFWKR